MDSRVFHHIFAFVGTAFFSLVAVLLYSQDLLNLSSTALAWGLAVFWLGNLIFSALFFLPLSEEFKYKSLVIGHVLWGQLGLISLGYFSPTVVEVSLMMSLATFAFVVFGISSFKLLPLIVVTTIGFGFVLFPEISALAFGKHFLILLTYVVSALFITVINAYVGNLQLFLANQNALIKTKSSELEKAHNDLLEAKEEAEQSSRSKTRFLAAASHDLRQPLYALELYIGSLANQSSKERDHVLTQMKKSAYELRELLNCLFDISRFDTDVAEVNIRRVRLDQVIADLDIEFKELSNKENRPLKIRSSNAVVQTDPILMHRIIRGLVTNALKHSKKGRVLLGFRYRKDKIRCEVWDSGEGIAHDDQEKIFEEFYQVRNSNRDRSQGLGLGLALIKRMCAALDHEFGMRSEPGKGTKFWFEMTRTWTEDAYVWGQNPSGLEEKANAGTVLCIDDEESILNGLSILLESWGYKVIAVTSHEDAIQRLSLHGDDPSVILSDYRLADEINGIDAMNQVNAFLRRKLPGIVVTGDLDKGIESQAAQFGYKVLLKPVSAAKLKLYLKNMMTRTGSKRLEHSDLTDC